MQYKTQFAIVKLLVKVRMEFNDAILLKNIILHKILRKPFFCCKLQLILSTVI